MTNLIRIFAIVGLSLVVGFFAWAISYLVGCSIGDYYTKNFDSYSGLDPNQHYKLNEKNFMYWIVLIVMSVIVSVLIIL